METKDLIERLSIISEMLEAGKGLIDENGIHDFQRDSKELSSKIDCIMQEGRLMKLGIVGAVKAGKSSLYNVFRLFKGYL